MKHTTSNTDAFFLVCFVWGELISFNFNNNTVLELQLLEEENRCKTKGMVKIETGSWNKPYHFCLRLRLCWSD